MVHGSYYDFGFRNSNSFYVGFVFDWLYQYGSLGENILKKRNKYKKIVKNQKKLLKKINKILEEATQGYIGHDVKHRKNIRGKKRLTFKEKLAQK